MTITAWRIVKARFAATAFDREGAFRFGGRWNSKGTRLVYTAGSQALAVLEMLVHLDASEMLNHYRLIPATFDETLVSEPDPRALPATWRRRPMAASVRAVGDAWAASARSPVLRVPSALVSAEHNYLLSPAHPRFALVSIGKPQPYRFDARLK